MRAYVVVGAPRVVGDLAVCAQLSAASIGRANVAVIGARRTGRLEAVGRASRAIARLGHVALALRAATNRRGRRRQREIAASAHAPILGADVAIAARGARRAGLAAFGRGLAAEGHARAVVQASGAAHAVVAASARTRRSIGDLHVRAGAIRAGVGRARVRVIAVVAAPPVRSACPDGGPGRAGAVAAATIAARAAVSSTASATRTSGAVGNVRPPALPIVACLARLTLDVAVHAETAGATGADRGRDAARSAAACSGAAAFTSQHAWLELQQVMPPQHDEPVGQPPSVQNACSTEPSCSGAGASTEQAKMSTNTPSKARASKNPAFRNTMRWAYLFIVRTVLYPRQFGEACSRTSGSAAVKRNSGHRGQHRRARRRGRPRLRLWKAGGRPWTGEGGANRGCWPHSAHRASPPQSTLRRHRFGLGSDPTSCRPSKRWDWSSRRGRSSSIRVSIVTRSNDQG